MTKKSLLIGNICTKKDHTPYNSMCLNRNNIHIYKLIGMQITHNLRFCSVPLRYKCKFTFQNLRPYERWKWMNNKKIPFWHLKYVPSFNVSNYISDLQSTGQIMQLLSSKKETLGHIHKIRSRTGFYSLFFGPEHR